MSTAFARDAELLRSLVHRIDPHDPGASNNLGVLYHTRGLHAEAVDAFLRALDLDPRMRIAARNLEIAAAAPGACEARLAALTARLAADPDDIAARREEARLYRLIGRHDEAARRFDALLAEYPDDGVALRERGLLEQRTGDLRRAQRWLERALNASPRDVVTRLHLAEVLYNRGANEQALAMLDGVLADDPSLADAHLLRGFVLGDLGRHEAALQATREATTLNPSLSTLKADLSLDGETSPMPVAVEEGGALARYSLGLAFRQRGYLDGARRELLRARELGEDHRLVEHAIAELDLITGESASAAASYEMLLSTYGDSARLWCEHGVALHQLGRVADAAQSYRRALREDPRHALSYNNLAVSLEHEGDGPAAREALLRAIDLEPTLVRARLNLARWYVRHRDVLSALSLLRELTAFQANDADAWCELGVVLALLRRPGEARQALARAIELEAGHAPARYALADVLATLGDQDGAARETQHALTIAPLRPESRLQLGIDLQRECPEATGAIDLLMLRASQPLDGVVVSEADVELLLPDAGTTREPVTELSVATMACDEGDAFAARGLHGEAQERYARAVGLCRAMTTAGAATTTAPASAPAAGEGSSDDCVGVQRRASIGDARSRCLLGRGHESVDAMRALDAAIARDAAADAHEVDEVLALRAATEAQWAAHTGGAVDAARDAMRRLLGRTPESAALLHFVGDAALAIGDQGLAMQLYRRALAEDPTRPTPRVSIARMLRLRGDVLAAQLELVAALSARPGMREARLELARVHQLRRRTGEALGLLTALLADDPTDVEVLVLLGEVLVDAERLADARIALAHARRHDPDHPRALLVEGRVLSLQGRTREARERFQRILATGPESEVAALARAALAHDALAHDAATFDHARSSAAHATVPMPTRTGVPVVGTR